MITSRLVFSLIRRAPFGARTPTDQVARSPSLKCQSAHTPQTTYPSSIWFDRVGAKADPVAQNAAATGNQIPKIEIGGGPAVGQHRRPGCAAPLRAPPPRDKEHDPASLKSSLKTQSVHTPETWVGVGRGVPSDGISFASTSDQDAPRRSARRLVFS